MFPSFKSLSDREQKRLDLLERAKRHVKQTQEKREMYASAAWNGFSKQLSQIKPSQKTEGTNTEDVFLKTLELRSNRPPQIDIPFSPPPSPELSPLLTSPMIKNEEMSPKTILDTRDLNYELLVDAFKKYPGLVHYRISPISSNTHKPLSRFIIVDEGNIITSEKGKRDHNLKKESIDWAETYQIVVNIINSIKHEHETGDRILKLYPNQYRTYMEINDLFSQNPDLKSMSLPMYIFNDKGESIETRRFTFDEGEIIDRDTGGPLNPQDFENFISRFDYVRTVNELKKHGSTPSNTTDEEMQDMEIILSVDYSNLSSKRKAHIDKAAREALINLFTLNKEKLKRIDLLPFDKKDDIIHDFKIDHESFIAVGRDKKPNENITKRVSWLNTYNHLITKLKRNKKFASLVLAGSYYTSTNPKDKSLRIRARSEKKNRGKGLIGAGGNIVYRRGNDAYNLNDIRGTGSKSSITYQPLGSKYIRMPDLNDCTLNIVYPSRVKVGPKRKISKDLQSMIKDLVHDAKISQSAYDNLNIDDKKLFKEILNATHVQHCFKEQLANPIDSLKAEFDKLRGELSLGNDNSSIIRQLKAVSIDMYRHKLITDEQFKEIMITI